MRRKVGKADGRIDTALFIEDRTAEFVKVESAAALPALSLIDAAQLPIHDFLETGDAVSMRYAGSCWRRACRNRPKFAWSCRTTWPGPA